MSGNSFHHPIIFKLRKNYPSDAVFQKNHEIAFTTPDASAKPMTNHFSYTDCLSRIAETVESFFERYRDPNLLYHNIEHVKYVVNRCEALGEHYKLPDEALFILKAAAWFHDCGQLTSYGSDHEEKSVEFMRTFFSGAEPIPDEVIEKIARCILATNVSKTPQNFLEEIICDADTFNIGSGEFAVTDKLLRKECDLKENKDHPDWNDNTLAFFKKHRYYTSYCRDNLAKGKEANAELVRQRSEDSNLQPGTWNLEP